MTVPTHVERSHQCLFLEQMTSEEMAVTTRDVNVGVRPAQMRMDLARMFRTKAIGYTEYLHWVSMTFEEINCSKYYGINNYIFICHTYFVEIGEVTTTGSPKKAEKVATPVKPFEGKEGKIYLLFGRIFFQNRYIFIYIHIHNIFFIDQ